MTENPNYIVFTFTAENNDKVEEQQKSFKLALDRAREKECPVLCVLDTEYLDKMLQRDPDKTLQKIVPEQFQGDTVTYTFRTISDAVDHLKTTEGFEISVT